MIWKRGSLRFKGSIDNLSELFRKELICNSLYRESPTQTYVLENATTSKREFRSPLGFKFKTLTNAEIHKKKVLWHKRLYKEDRVDSPLERNVLGSKENTEHTFQGVVYRTGFTELDRQELLLLSSNYHVSIEVELDNLETKQLEHYMFDNGVETTGK